MLKKVEKNKKSNKEKPINVKTTFPNSKKNLFTKRKVQKH